MGKRTIRKGILAGMFENIGVEFNSLFHSWRLDILGKAAFIAHPELPLRGQRGLDRLTG